MQRTQCDFEKKYKITCFWCYRRRCLSETGDNNVAVDFGIQSTREAVLEQNANESNQEAGKNEGKVD